MADHPLVLIEWEDSVRPDGAWRHVNGFKPSGVVRVASVGWLVKDGKRTKVLAPNVAADKGKKNRQISGAIQIPARCVIRVTKLKEARRGG